MMFQKSVRKGFTAVLLIQYNNRPLDEGQNKNKRIKLHKKIEQDRLGFCSVSWQKCPLLFVICRPTASSRPKCCECQIPVYSPHLPWSLLFLNGSVCPLLIPFLTGEEDEQNEMTLWDKLLWWLRKKRRVVWHSQQVNLESSWANTITRPTESWDKSCVRTVRTEAGKLMHVYVPKSN